MNKNFDTLLGNGGNTMNYWNDDSYNVNRNVILQEQKQIQDLNDVLCKAYFAGYITRYGTLLVFGTGAERGTYGQFANIMMSETGFQNSREALTYFTNIYSTAMRNQGVNNNRKKHFFLSQYQEIMPVLNFFGLAEMFKDIWEETKIFDALHNLNEEWKNNKKIENWQTRTKLTTIQLKDKEVEIMDEATRKIFNDNGNILEQNGITNGLNLLQSVFIEGTRGWALGSTDMEILKRNGNLWEQYNKENNKIKVA